MLRDPFTPRLRTLRQLWNETVKEGVPEMFKAQLDAIDEACRDFSREMGQTRGDGDCPDNSAR
jgi:hypothetical protein